MTSGITIGRMGIDIEVPGLSAAGWVDDGDNVTITAMHWALGVEEGRALRQQILGLPSTTDPHYLTSTDDPGRDGWYRVLSANVTSEALLVSDGHLSWTATLQRPLNYAALRPEIMVSGTNRTSNPFSGLHWVGIPEGYGWGLQDGTPTSLDDRFLADGTQVTIASGIDLATRNTIRMIGPPSIYYSASCVFKVNGYPTIGRQTFRNPTDWELSNGFVTITPGVTDSAIFTIAVQNPGGGGTPPPTLSYELELGVNPGVWSPGADQTIHSVQVLRDTVEEVVIRISGTCNLNSAGIPRNGFSVDLSLRRGALGVDMTPAFVEADYYGFGWVTTVASSTISAHNVGIRKTTSDADGMSPVIVHPPAGFIGAWDRDLVNGRVWLDVAPWAGGASFFIGLSSQAYAASDALDLQAAYFSTLRGRQRMVSP